MPPRDANCTVSGTARSPGAVVEGAPGASTPARIARMPACPTTTTFSSRNSMRWTRSSGPDGPRGLGKVFVDSAPVLERDFAEQAGLGFIGRNCCLITPGLGRGRCWRG